MQEKVYPSEIASVLWGPENRGLQMGLLNPKTSNPIYGYVRNVSKRKITFVVDYHILCTTMCRGMKGLNTCVEYKSQLRPNWSEGMKIFWLAASGAESRPTKQYRTLAPGSIYVCPDAELPQAIRNNHKPCSFAIVLPDYDAGDRGNKVVPDEEIINIRVKVGTGSVWLKKSNGEMILDSKLWEGQLESQIVEMKMGEYRRLEFIQHGK
jgi:hypothetical protein